jgi:hypothetical protein
MSNKKYSDIKQMDHSWISSNAPDSDQNNDTNRPYAHGNQEPVARVGEFFKGVLPIFSFN